MSALPAQPELVACCGLYCGACRAQRKGKCPGCRDNAKAKWCTVRSCCLEKGIRTCAECTDFADPMACSKYNNFMARLFGFVFRSDRAACIVQIKQLGLEGHAQAMAEQGRQSIRR